MDLIRKVYIIGEVDTIFFAGSELVRCLTLMSSGSWAVEAEHTSRFDPNLKDGLWIGLMEDFCYEFSDADNRMDDVIRIDVQGCMGIIAGINPRSSLLGVYRFLTEAGCRWVRPGRDGELIPERNLSDINACIDERASYRHRGICIEGAVSYENIADMIDWAPKVGFNTYYMQFRESFTFFDRWYSHQGNPYAGAEPFTVEKAREFKQKVEKEIKKRDLLYHAIGHGWTCEPFGVPGLGWDKVIRDPLPEIAPFLAEIDGKREYWQGLPLNTNLCYSNPEVREKITKDITGFLENNKNIDVLHFWLADGANNNCECADCSGRIPSDFYIMMLNNLDVLLTSKGIGTKIVFSVYLDLMWPPQSERIKNTDRFIMMFAPITRRYSESYSTMTNVSEIEPYTRNKLVFPASVGVNAAFLKEWQKIYDGDSFIFDYHFMWDHYLDPAYCKISNILSKDVKSLEKMGLNGLLSCQVQRAFFPNGLGMYAMGKTLWNKEEDFSSIKKDYFTSTYGDDGNLCMEYLEALSRLFDMDYMKGEKSAVNNEYAQRFGEIPGVINQFRPVIENNLNNRNQCRARSWLYLKYHADICYLLALSMQANAKDNVSISKLLWEATADYVWKHEAELQQVLDVFEFVGVHRNHFNDLWEHKKFNFYGIPTK